MSSRPIFDWTALLAALRKLASKFRRAPATHRIFIDRGDRSLIIECTAAQLEEIRRNGGVPKL